MLFNSLEFLFFLPIVVALYYLINPRFRWILLLIASYYFYMCWNYKYIVLILFSTVIDYFIGIFIYKTNKQSLKKVYLYFAIFTNLGLLFFFKYYNFFGDSLNYAFKEFNIFYNVPSYHYLLPVGISFYTFQALSYVIDIYRNHQKPEYHFGRFALFVSFFPQLVAGPIERSVNLLPQFRQTFTFDYERVKNGILLMCWGFFKKVVIADRLAEYVNIVYNNPMHHEGLQNIIATFFFSFQIYCDFSGYSDIAVGTAMIMGYTLMTNFRRPYLSKSIKEFWSRWHISLSTWFRDYVYIPLGGNRVSKARWQTNLFITFFVSGLWHGAEWTFVIWGALHGFYLIFAIWTDKLKNRINNFTRLSSSPAFLGFVQTLVTFVLVFFAWIFFRANNTSDAFLIINKTFTFSGIQELNLFKYPIDFYISFSAIAFLLMVEVLEEKVHLWEAFLSRIPRPVKWSLLTMLVMGIVVFGAWNSTDFLYFQF